MSQIIINIHGIGPIDRPLAPDEDKYWISTELFTQAVEIVAQSDRDVCFTFDDGNVSDIEIGAPLLNAHGLKARFFVLAGRTDQPHFLSAAHICQLQEMGHQIGSHGWDHVDWTGLDETGMTREIREAKAAIEAVCGKPVREAGIPFGRYNHKVLGALKQAGFTHAYSSDGGHVRGKAFPTPRTSLQRHMDARAIHDIIAGREPLKKSLRRAVTTRLKRVL